MRNIKEGPLIGITMYGRNRENHFTLPSEYVDAVRRAGGIPVLLPPGGDESQLLLDLLDGIILAGGGDCDPRRYGGEMHPSIYSLDEERDRMEFALAEQMLSTEIPALCICRGMQVLAIALGGTLYEHLPDHVGETLLHRKPPREPVRHQVTIDEKSLLASALQSVTAEVVSWHHQAIRRLPADLKVVARAADGIVEAVEMPSRPGLLAVQWHPELSAATDRAQQRLFDVLIARAAEYSRI